LGDETSGWWCGISCSSAGGLRSERYAGRWQSFADTDTYADTYAHPDADSHTYTHSDSHSDSDAHTNADSHAFTHR
jgi:hypothetical protein